MDQSLMRLKDWRPRLDDYLQSIEGKGFDWAELNCAFFVADCVLAMTGVDMAAEFRGKVTDLASALVEMQRHGYVDHIDFAEKHLAEIPVGEATFGDIAVVDGEIDHAFALFQGHALIAMTPKGKGFMPRRAAKRAFHIPMPGQ